MSGCNNRRPMNTLDIEYLFLDLTACTRCVSSAANLIAALELVHPVLAAMGVTVTMGQVHVASLADAQRERLVSSPTIRINHRDIAEVQETACEECSAGCGCEGGTLCRVWTYRGEQFTEAPVGYIVEAIMETVFACDDKQDQALAQPEQLFDVPENLVRFFQRKLARQSGEGETTVPCCDPENCNCGENCDCDSVAAVGCGCA